MNINRLFGLETKTAVVTGGAGHLGAAISAGLAEAGADVFIASRNIEQCRQLAEVLQEKYAVDCSGIYLDIADQASVRGMFCSDCRKNRAYRYPGQ